MESFLAVAGNVASAVSLIMSNKQLVANDFDFMVVLTGIHFYTSFLCCLLALMFGILHYRMVSNHFYLFRISMASLMSIIFMNLNLAHNSVAFYQISKLCCIPLTLFLEYLFGMGKQQMSASLGVALILIVGGMALVSEGDIEYTTEGLVYMSLGILGTSIGQIWFAPLQKELGLNSMQMLFHTSPIIAFCCFLLTPAVEDGTRLWEVELTAPLLLNLFGSSMMAFFLNLTGYKLLQLTSPLTYQIVGHLKTILVLLFGIIYFDNVPSQSVLAGVGLGMLGVIIYNQTSSKKNSSTLVVKSMDDSEEKEEGFGDNEEATETDSLLSSPNSQGIKDRVSRKSVTSSTVQNKYVQDRADPIAAAPDLEVQTKGIDLFKEAVRKVGDPSTQWRRAADTDTKLKLYGLFKYAEKGPCVDDSSRPSIWDPVGQRKWDAWKEVGEESFSRDQARAAYVDIVAECMDL
jgi:solute carrier family 35 protein E3